MQYAIYLLVMLFLGIVEATIFEFPLVLIALISFAAIKKDATIFFLAFFSGFFLDMLLLRTFGLTSVVFVTFLFLIMLYQRKFEIGSLYFVGFATFFLSFFYALIFSYSLSLLQATGSVFLAILFFSLLRILLIKAEKPLVI